MRREQEPAWQPVRIPRYDHQIDECVVRLAVNWTPHPPARIPLTSGGDDAFLGLSQKGFRSFSDANVRPCYTRNRWPLWHLRASV